jgi:predicted phage tail protein
VEDKVRARLTVLLAAMCLAAAAGGCDGDGGGDEEVALTADEFARKANALCSEAAADRQTVLSGIDPESSGPEQAELLANIIDIDEKLLEEVDDLVPPEKDQDTVDQLLDQWRDRIDLEQQLREATANDDAGEVAALEGQITEVDAAANPIAGGLRLNECTRGERV